MGLCVTYTKSASKDLKAVSANVLRTIRGKIETYASQPEALANNVIQMTGSTFYRLRVGDYRVIFELSDVCMNIIAVKPRGSAYE